MHELHSATLTSIHAVGCKSQANVAIALKSAQVGVCNTKSSRYHGPLNVPFVTNASGTERVGAANNTFLKVARRIVTLDAASREKIRIRMNVINVRNAIY